MPAPTAHTLTPSLAPPSPLPPPPRTLSTPPRTLTPPRRPAQVVIFSKTTCPFCRKTKDLFDGLDVKYTSVELDEMDNGPDVQDALLDSSGQRTVPNVVI